MTVVSLPIPEVPAPHTWAGAPDDALPAVPDLLPEALAAHGRSYTDQALDRSRPDVGGFASALEAVLVGPAHSAVVTSFRPGQIATVVSLIAALLGDAGYRSREALGGPVSIVTAGARLRHDQAWHTDSTPWSVPNRWTVLGLLREDPAHRRAPTGVLPWDEIDRDWTIDPALQEELRVTPLSWRANFPQLPALQAPVRGTVPRWIRPAVAAVRHTLPHSASAALQALDHRLSTVTQWYEAVIQPARVLVFDNYAVLHRGPEIHEVSRRTLLRIKVDGCPLHPWQP